VPTIILFSSALFHCSSFCLFATFVFAYFVCLWCDVVRAMLLVNRHAMDVCAQLKERNVLIAHYLKLVYAKILMVLNVLLDRNRFIVLFLIVQLAVKVNLKNVDWKAYIKCVNMSVLIMI
jgi:hypothetical protein